MPPGSSAQAAMPPSTSPSAPRGTASRPSCPPSETDDCPLCQEPMAGPKGFATTPCGHRFCMQCLVTHDAVNARDGTFPCPMCRHALSSTVREAQAVSSMPERAVWDREQEQLDTMLAIAVSWEEAEPPPPPSLLPHTSSLLPRPEAHPDFLSLSHGALPVHSRDPGVSSPPIAHPPPPQHQLVPAPSGAGVAPALGGEVRAAVGRASTSEPWRRRAQRQTNDPQPFEHAWRSNAAARHSNASSRQAYDAQPFEHAWRTNAAARHSNASSRSTSVVPSRSGRHRSRSASPPPRPPTGAFSDALMPGPSLSPQRRPREIPSIEWGSGIRRQVAWGSALPFRFPPPPPSEEGGRRRW